MVKLYAFDNRDLQEIFREKIAEEKNCLLMQGSEL